MSDTSSSPETAERVFRMLHRVHRDGFVSASCRDIAEELQIGRSTAQRALNRLADEGRLTVARRGSGHLYPTTYRIGGTV